MAKANIVRNNMVGGEISPLLYGRVDIPLFEKALARCENFIVNPQGGATFRSGTRFVKYTRNNLAAVFIPFSFNDNQSYLLELTNVRMRFYRNEGAILETAKTITNITKANPGVFTTSAVHGFAVGEEVFISGVGGMTEVNGRFFYVSTVPTTTTFTLQDVFGTILNTTSFTTFTSGGSVARVYTITTPFAAADLEDIKFAQTADIMYLAHPNYETQLLTRVADTNWTITTPSWQTTGANLLDGTANRRPRAVAFSQDGRLIVAGTNERPDTIWGSKTPNPNNGNTQYHDFRASIPTVATDGFAFQLASLNGKVDQIQWITNTNKFLTAGTSGTVRRLFGSTEDQPVTPLAVNAKPVNTFGVDRATPAPVGSSIFYIERGALRVRNLIFDIQIDSYDTTDMNLASEHLSRQSEQCVYQIGSPEVLWVRKLDGLLIGLTYKERENIAGWHRHYLGGSHIDSNNTTQPFSKVTSLGLINRPDKGEQLWFIVQRRINGQTVNCVEFITDPPAFPIRADFYTGVEATDKQKFLNAVYESQKDAIHMDMSATYDGTQAVVLSPSATTGNITMTAGGAVFTSNMVGREIWKKYDARGGGGGKATITGFTSSTVVTCSVTVPFDSVSQIPVNGWLITTAQLTNLHHLEGTTVGVVLDGAPSTDLTVASGILNLPKQASKAHVGLKYSGTLQTLNLDFGGTTGSAQSKPRQFRKVFIRFINTVSAAIGTSLYRLSTLVFPREQMDRPVPLFSGVIEKKLFDGTQQKEKQFIIKHEQPLPMTVTAIDLHGETTDE